MATFPLIHPKEKEHINDSEISAHDQQVHKVLENAAITIQKNYRGYRARRQLNGLGLSTATRWTEVSLDYVELYLLQTYHGMSGFKGGQVS